MKIKKKKKKLKIILKMFYLKEKNIIVTIIKIINNRL